MLDLKYFESLPICTLSDIFETIPKTVATIVVGSIITIIKLPINCIANKIIGCITFAVVMLPVVISNVMRIGTKFCIKPTRF